MRNPLHRIITHTGIEFWPTDPQPEWVDIRDIAHGLSNMARFNGHTHSFYSVAQHSILVSYLVPTEHALWGLLHDASEAYVADLVRPVKVQLPAYRDIEQRLLQCIAGKFNLPWPEPAEVKTADNALMLAERRDLMPRPELLESHTSSQEAYAPKIVPVGPGIAKTMFLHRYRELTMPAGFRPCVGGSCGWESDLAVESLVRIADDIANRKTL